MYNVLRDYHYRYRVDVGTTITGIGQFDNLVSVMGFIPRHDVPGMRTPDFRVWDNLEQENVNWQEIERVADRLSGIPMKRPDPPFEKVNWAKEGF